MSGPTVRSEVAAGFGGVVSDSGEALARLCNLEPGRILARSRTTESAVVEVPGAGSCVRKRWWWPQRRDRFRGVLRTTVLARSPAEREYRALGRLQALPSGAFAPQPLAFFDVRAGAVLRECLLLLRYVPESRDLANWLVSEPDPACRQTVLRDLADRTRAMHAAGLADGELHPRNVLVTQDPLRTWKVDCAKQRQFAGDVGNRRASFDLACLDVGLSQLASTSERLRALLRYLGNAPRTDCRRWARRIDLLRRRLMPREGRRLPRR